MEPCTDPDCVDARKFGNVHMHEKHSDNDVSYAHAMDGLKDKINALVWVHCPGTTTLATADRIAGAMHELIEAAWRAKRDA